MISFLSFLFFIDKNLCTNFKFNKSIYELDQFEIISSNPCHCIIKEKKDNPKNYMIVPPWLKKQLVQVYENVEGPPVNIIKDILVTCGSSFPHSNPIKLFFLTAFLLEYDIQSITTVDDDVTKTWKATLEKFDLMYGKKESSEHQFWKIIYETEKISHFHALGGICQENCFTDSLNALSDMLGEKVSRNLTNDVQRFFNSNYSAFKMLKDLALCTFENTDYFKVFPFVHLIISFCGLNKGVIRVRSKNEIDYYVEIFDLEQQIQKILRLLSLNSRKIVALLGPTFKLVKNEAPKLPF